MKIKVFINLLKAILISIIIFLLHNCTVIDKTKLYGTYTLKEENKPYRIIEIKEDGTFLYKSVFHLENSITEGYWKLINQNLKLNTFDNYILNLHTINEFKDNSLPADKVTLIIENGSGWLSLNNKTIYDSDNEGKIEIDKKNLIDNSFKLHVGDYLEGMVYKIKEKETNLIKITINFEDFVRFPLEEKFKVKSNKLIDKFGYIYLKH